MIATSDTWILMGDVPFYIPKGQEFTTNNEYEEFDSLEDFVERLNELGIGYDLESFKSVEKLPDWDNFNVTMMSNPRFNQVYNQCLAVAPIVANSLPVALDQLTTKGCSLFRIIWGQLCTIGGATQEDKLVWGGYAIENNLPQEFIDILRG